MDDGLPAYAAAFLGSLLATLALTPLALRVATRRGVLDLPGGHKSHASPVPYLGGVAMVLAFSLAVVAAALLAPVAAVGELGAILGMGVVLALVGLVDDLRGLGLGVRVAAEVAAGVGVWALGSGVQLVSFEPVNLVLTVLWVVGITNAFNLLDNMDGLSAGVASIASLSFLVIAAVNGQYLVAALAAGLAGCAVGFLRHNRHPARIYMGDAGSLFLGFMLAVIGVRLRFDAPAMSAFLVPPLVLAVPIFDTALVMIGRLAHGRSPFAGGRDHTSHRLVFIGLSVRVAVSVVWAAGAFCGWLGLIVARVDQASAFMLVGLVAAFSAVLGVLFGRIPVYANSSRRHLMLQEVALRDPEETA